MLSMLFRETVCLSVSVGNISVSKGFYKSLTMSESEKGNIDAKVDLFVTRFIFIILNKKYIY